MKTFTILSNVRMALDAVDGPGWTDEVNDVNDSSKLNIVLISKAKTRDRNKKSKQKAKV